MRKLILLTGIIAVLIASCNNQSNTRKRTTSKKTAQTFNEVLDYQMKDILMKDTTCTNSDILKCTHVRLAYPEFLGTHAGTANMLTRDLITYLLYDKDLGTSRSNDLKKVTDDFLLNYYKLKRSFPDLKQTWYFRLNSRPLYEQDSVLCFAFDYDTYTGGAHGLRGRYFLNLNRYTGKKLWPLSLVKDMDAFSQLAEKKFREIKGIKPGESLNDAGFKFENNQFRLPANIGLSDKGFILRYNLYEIAPYALGPTEFTISYREAGIKK